MTESASEAIIRSAYEGFAEGDLAWMLQFVDPDLEWTYLDPADEDPQPQVCHGRHELATALKACSTRTQVIHRGGAQSGRPGHGAGAYTRDRQMSGVQGDDRNYNVLTVRGDQIVAIRDCRDRAEAIAVAGIE
jgi:ketosteroid isomerase-like protein